MLKTSTVGKRNLIKCAQCRRDKTRCEPLPTDQKTQRVKCRRCTKLGHHCGPLERAQRSRSLPRPPNESPSSSASPSTNGSSTTEIPGPRPPFLWYDHIGMPTSSSRRAVVCERRLDLLQAEDDLLARSLLTKLGDLYAARELIGQISSLCDFLDDPKDLRFCKDVCMRDEAAVVHTSSVRAALTSAVRAVIEDFEHTIRQLLTVGSKLEIDRAHNYVIPEMQRIMYQFQYPPSTMVPSTDKSRYITDCGLLQQVRFASQHSNVQYSAAEFLCRDMQQKLIEPKRRCASHKLNAKTYIDASNGVCQALAGIVLDDLEHELILNRWLFPPSHLAYVNGDFDIAVDLWRDSSGKNEVNILGQSLPHLVAYAADVPMLRRLLRCDQDACATNERDAFGLTPLHVAAIRGHTGLFSLLLQQGHKHDVTDFQGRTALQLAVDNGFHDVVASLLSSGGQFTKEQELVSFLASQKSYPNSFCARCKSEINGRYMDSAESSYSSPENSVTGVDCRLSLRSSENFYQYFSDSTLDILTTDNSDDFGLSSLHSNYRGNVPRLA